MGLGGLPHLHAVLRETNYCDGFLIICHPIFSVYRSRTGKVK